MKRWLRLATRSEDGTALLGEWWAVPACIVVVVGVWIDALFG